MCSMFFYKYTRKAIISYVTKVSGKAAIKYQLKKGILNLLNIPIVTSSNLFLTDLSMVYFFSYCFM